MNLSFYKKEATSLQSLFLKFSEMPFNFKHDKSIDVAKATHSKGALIVGLIIVGLILGMVGMLTMWLLN